MSNPNIIAAEVVAAQRFLMGLYYAHGRNDAALYQAERVDAIAFAERYAAQWDEFQRGACSFMPSVQDAFDIYRRSQAVK